MISLSIFYKIRANVIFILLIVFALYTSVNITGPAFQRLRLNNMIHRNESTFIDGNLNLSDTGIELKENIDTQVFDEIAFDKFVLYIKNMQILFFKLIVILSFYQFCLYIRRWIILVYQFKIKFFVMRFLELKDGKKDALSIQFNF